MSVPAQEVEVQGSCVALIDDDDLFRESLGLNLSEEGYEVIDFSNGQNAIDFLLSNTPEARSVDVVLLDWRMPVMDGLEVLRRLRAARFEVPVIFLTVLSDEIYEEAALKFGAVDFIDKSRRLSIILQRLKLITRGPKAQSSENPDATVFKAGPLELNNETRRAFWHGEQVDLTLTEYTIVAYLASRPGEDVTYRQIYDLVRGKDFVAGYGAEGFRANVRAFIKRIRKKFRDIDENFEHIENYPGFGYRWKVEGSDSALALSGDSATQSL
jgi:two-component system response regulator ChvI